MDNKCYRCGTKNQCSQEYRADSSNPVNTKAQKILKINTSNARDKPIECCVQCISPGSRMKLHKREVFVKPENMFLNYIVSKVDKKITEGLTKTFNIEEITQTNPDKVDKYDMTLSKGNRYILVEIDEKQHFEKRKFHEDRGREKRFWSNHPGSPVLRIRVGDGTTKFEKVNACIIRDRGKCSIVDQEKFNNNMIRVIDHIVSYLDGSNVIQHAYIEFFNRTGIQDFKKVFEYTPATKNNSLSTIMKSIQMMMLLVNFKL